MSWEQWAPTSAEPWNLERVVHLHRRAGFGADWERIQADLADGHAAAIERVLEGVSKDGANLDPLIKAVGQSAVGSNRPERLKAWWMLRVVKSPHPLREKLTLMWHNHFATSNAKVKRLAAMKRQNELFLSFAAGPFSDVLNAVARDPAMLIWLDAPSNKKGRPNENLARELMELFTLGVGNYTEHDVRDAARALTGWGLDEEEDFFVSQRAHDDGSKSILEQTGNWGGQDLLRILLDHPATADRLAWRLCQTFMGEAVVDANGRRQLAKQLRQKELDVGATVETIIRSKAFFSAENIGSRVASPVEFIATAIRAFKNSDATSTKLARWAGELGQDLFYPPNVGGWTGGRSWLSSRYVIGRANFATALVTGRLGGSRSPPDIAGLVRRNGGELSLAGGMQHLSELLLGKRLPQELEERIQTAVRKRAKDLKQQLSLATALLIGMPQAQMV